MLEEIRRLNNLVADVKFDIGRYGDNADMIATLQRKKVGIRKDIRSLHLARMILKGRKYAQVERTTRTKPDWDAVAEALRDDALQSGTAGLAKAAVAQFVA